MFEGMLLLNGLNYIIFLNDDCPLPVQGAHVEENMV